MDVSDQLFDCALTPTAAYAPTINSNSGCEGDPWEYSVLNPKNRIDSLDVPKPCMWRFEGIDVAGSRFFIVPKFAIGAPPQRIDVFVPKHLLQSSKARSALQSNCSVLPSKDSGSKLAITQFLLRVLTLWSSRDPGFCDRYKALPFGSRIIVESLGMSHYDTIIHLVPVYEVEKQWRTLHFLESQWKLPPHNWPTIIPIDDVALCRQPHEAISIVQIPRLCGEQMLVFKSLVRDIKYLYHELHMLLTNPEHNNILGRPLFIVVKKGRFGSKLGVCGFVMEYYSNGTLRESLTRDDNEACITMAHRFQWSLQLTSAVKHIQNSPMGYYPDLKPDNLILKSRGDEMDMLLIDMEQRGGWYSWTPCEVSFVEFVEYLACSDMVDPEVSKKHAELMRLLCPGWRPPTITASYNASDGQRGFSSAWSQLDSAEREAAQVFMLGKLLWCIFESQPSINCGISPDLLREHNPAFHFPQFVQTPIHMQDLIRRCTKGAREWDGKFRPVELRDDKLVLSDTNILLSNPEAVQKAVKEWWAEEIDLAVQYVQRRISNRRQSSDQREMMAARGRPEGFAGERPSLAQVWEALSQESRRH